MKPSDQRKIIRTEEEIQEYYDHWFHFWYSGDEYDLPHDFWENWHDYQNDPVRLRQEKIEEIFDLNSKPTLKDIWPKQ